MLVKLATFIIVIKFRACQYRIGSIPNCGYVSSCVITGHVRFLIASQVVYVTCLRRMSGADTTGRDGHVDTRPRRRRDRNRKSRDLPRALLRVRQVRRRARSVGRRALRDTRWPRVLSGALLRAAAGAEAGARRRRVGSSDNQDCSSSSNRHERTSTETPSSHETTTGQSCCQSM